MSDIIIRGMEMPKYGCDNCFLRTGNYCGRIDKDESVVEYARKSERHPDCPLVELPPHGRLGDLDRLEKRFTPVEAYYPTEEDRRDYDNGRLMIRDIRSAIKDAPTIIPASEER